MKKFYKSATHGKQSPTLAFNNKVMGDSAGIYEDSEFPVLVSSKVTNRYSLFVDNTLSGPQDARFIVQSLSNATEDDEVVMYLSSGGGSVAAGQMIIQAMQHCAAPITVVGSGDICSMAAIILCSCESFVLDPHAGIMLHAATGGYAGGMGDIETYAKFQKKQLEGLLDYYSIGILTETDLDLIHKEKKEIWLDVEDFTSRFRRKIKAQDALMEYIDEAGIAQHNVTPAMYVDLMKVMLKEYEEEEAAKKLKKPSRKPAVKKTTKDGCCSSC